MLLLSFASLLVLLLCLKKPTFLRMKILFSVLSLNLVFFFAQSLLLKKRVSSFQTIDLKSAPFKNAPINISLSPNSDLIVLKNLGDWLVLQSQDKHTGWVKKQEVFQIF